MEESATAVETVVSLSQCYTNLARLAFSGNRPDYLKLTTSLQSLTEQLTCGSCGNFTAENPYPDPNPASGQGIVCQPCYGRKRNLDFTEDEEMAFSLVKSTVKNISILVNYLVEEAVSNMAQEVGDASDDDDPEVSFSPQSVLALPNHHKLPVLGMKVVKKKCLERLKSLNTLLGNTNPPPSPEPQLTIGKPQTNGRLQLKELAIKLSPLQQQENLKSAPKRKGCRCGVATSIPGKLTCCGQRCPCYVNSKSCTHCKCRGCRNPNPAVGRKRPLSGVTPEGTTPTKIIIASTRAGSPFRKSQVVLSKVNF